MSTFIHKTTRSHFLHILLNKDSINKLPENKMRRIIGRIMDDLDEEGILDPIDYQDDYDELEVMSQIEFDDSKNSEEKRIALEILVKSKTDLKSQNKGIVASESLERIRRKRRELAKDPRSGIVLTPCDLEEDAKDVPILNSYGRTAAHEAIGMRNLEAVQKYINEGLYLTEKDNNGNTPYQMAFQEGYTEAIEIFAAAGITI